MVEFGDFFARLRNVGTLIVRSRKIAVGLGFLVPIVCLGVLADIINNCRGIPNPLALGYYRYLSPSPEYPLGTDHVGRDLLALTLIGIKNSLLIGVTTGTIATLIGVTIALTSAWAGRRTGEGLNLFTNAVLVIPALPIMIAISTYMSMSGFFELSVLLAVFSWPLAARQIRSQALSLKTRQYIDLAILSNEGRLRIIFAEIFPNLVPYVVVGFSHSVINAMMAEAGLRLIGLGPSLLPSLGSLFNECLQSGAFAAGRSNMVVPPIAVFVVVFAAINLINSGLDEFFNPRLRKVTGM